jgi:hypothetical protein
MYTYCKLLLYQYYIQVLVFEYSVSVVYQIFRNRALFEKKPIRAHCI